jgi:hypothetical protein
VGLGDDCLDEIHTSAVVWVAVDCKYDGYVELEHHKAFFGSIVFIHCINVVSGFRAGKLSSETLCLYKPMKTHSVARDHEVGRKANTRAGEVESWS